jgi:hypothetical protein
MTAPDAKKDNQGSGAKTGKQENAWSRDQALALLKKYEDQGWAVKQQMLAIFGLLTPVVFGLVAYCVKNAFSKEAPAASELHELYVVRAFRTVGLAI